MLVATHMARCLIRMHEKGVVHGDVKPRNVVRFHGKYVFIDMDASLEVGVPAENAKLSTAYAPPELAGAVLRAAATGGEGEGGEARHVPSTAQDAWALGATLYLMLTGCSLVWTDMADNTADSEALRELASWDLEAKEKRFSEERLQKLRKSDARYAKNLLWQLLEGSIEKRLTLPRALAHPFLCHGKSLGRLPGEKWVHDVFLSYRKASDLENVKSLAQALRNAGLSVWWDVELKAGKAWLPAFCAALRDACLFVPLLSRGAVSACDAAGAPLPERNWTALRADSATDNVLLEHRLAVELQEFGLIQGVLPVFIGDSLEGGGRGNYFVQGCAPKPLPGCSVAAVEAEVRTQLDGLGLGTPHHEGMSVAAVWTQVTSHQGTFWEGGCEAEGLSAVVQKVVNFKNTVEQP